MQLNFFQTHIEKPKIRDENSISGKVIEVLSCNLTTNFLILKILTDKNEEIIVSGDGEQIQEHDEIEASGKFEITVRQDIGLKYKLKTFHAKRIYKKLEDTENTIFLQFNSKDLPGIGIRTAQKIKASYPEDFIEAIHSKKMMLACGIDPDKTEKIFKHFLQRDRFGRVMSHLQSLGANKTVIQNILDKYKDKTLEILKDNPYRLIQEIKNVSFKTADKIAINNGIPKLDPKRIQACINFIISQEEGQNGDCFIPTSLILQKSKELLAYQATPDVEKQIEDMIIHHDLYLQDFQSRPALMRRALHNAEVLSVEYTLPHLKTLSYEFEEIQNLCKKACEDLKIHELHETQIEAVHRSVNSGISIITGNPGTGKTSTLAVILWILEYFQKDNPAYDIQLTAPTGRAAQRMGEQTKRTALTLHRFLGTSPHKKGFLHDQTNQIQCDVVIIDEMSMIDIYLYKSIMVALKPETKIIFVGDVDQLPSVGPGQVLRDLIKSGIIPKTKLTHIFRQGAGSGISLASQKVNNGQKPGFFGSVDKDGNERDYWGIKCQTPEEVLKEILETTTKTLKKRGFNPLKDTQVLVPGKQHSCGVLNLNFELQKLINPKKQGLEEIVINSQIFRQQDRVIQNTNNYDLDVYNGDIGFIKKITPTTLIVEFNDKVVDYSHKDARQLSLAYATTIHRSQGSEYPAVVVGLSTQHFIMLERNLLYTAISRARSLCTLVAQEKALYTALTKGTQERKTGLAQKLIKTHHREILKYTQDFQKNQ